MRAVGAELHLRLPVWGTMRSQWRDAVTTDTALYIVTLLCATLPYINALRGDIAYDDKVCLSAEWTE